jgi:hypothetical protein
VCQIAAATEIARAVHRRSTLSSRELSIGGLRNIPHREATLSDLEQAEWSDRIARLERRERRMTAIVVMLLLLTITSTAWHLLPGTSGLQTSALALQNGTRFPRAAFSLSPAGMPAIRFNNGRGEALALWSLREDGTLNFRMSDAHFTDHVDLNVDPDGWPSLTLTAPNRRVARLWFDGGIARLDGVEPRTP